MIKNLRYLCTLLLIAVASAAWGEEESVTFSEQGYSNAQEITSYTGTNFSITFDKGTNNNAPKYYTTGTAIRLYGSNTFTISSENTLTKVVLSFGSSDGSNEITADEGSYDNGTWTGSAKSITFTIGGTTGNRRLSGLTVTYTPAVSNKVAKPVVSGITPFYPSTEVSITCGTDGAIIQYSTDGTTWSNYNEPFTITETTTVYAKATKEGLTDSEVASKTFTKATVMTIAEAREAIDAGTGVTNVYVKGFISQIDSYNSTYGSITYWISEDGTTTNQFEVYGGLNLNNTQFSSIDDVVLGAEVVVFGNIKKYNDIYEFDKNNYLVSYVAPTISVAAPVFSPEAGTYTKSQNVTITCETEGATIYYTVDGEEPTSASTEYTGAISVSTTTTIKAIAIVGSDESTVATATYHFCSAESPYTVAQALAFNEYPANGIYVSGIVSTAPTQAPTNNGEMTYYISDNGEATNQLEVYKGKGLNQAAFTTQDDIKVGDIVTIYGNVKIYNGTTEFESGNYLVAFERPQSTDPVINAENVTIAYNVTEGSIAYTIENGDENTTLSASTEATWLTLGTVTESSVPFTCSVNDDDPDRTATVILTYGDVSKEVTVTQKQKDCADLPFVWEGGVKADLLAITGVTAKGLGTDYAESHEKYRVKFDETGDYIQVKTNERPGIVTIGVKMIGGATASSIIVQQSVDGNTFTDLQTLTISGSTNEVLTLSTTTAFEESSRYVRLYFTKGSNVGVGPITIAQYADIVLNDYILAIADPENVNITATYGTDGILQKGENVSITEGTEITLAITPASGYIFENLTISGEEEGQTVTPVATSTEGVWTFTMPSFNVTINATVTEYVAPVTANYTLATTITPGKRYVIANSKEGSVKVMGDQGNNNRPEADATIANGVLTTLEQYEFVINNAVIDDVSGYSIYDESVPGYLYAAGSDKNYLKTQAENNINGLWTITIDEETGAASVVAEKSSNRNVMQYNSTNLLFACYASASQSPVYLFEKETKLGDVNNDGHVDVADVTALVNALKKGEKPEEGDIDGENGVNAEDVRALVEMILRESNQ